MAVPPQLQSGSLHLLTSHLEAAVRALGVGCTAFGRDGSFGASVVRDLMISLLFVGRDFLFDSRRITDMVVCFGFGVRDVVLIVLTVVGFAVVVVVVYQVLVVPFDVVVVGDVVVCTGVDEKTFEYVGVLVRVTGLMIGFDEEVKVDGGKVFLSQLSF